MLTKRGNVVVPRENLSGYELIWKAMGMNPDQIRIRYEGNSAVKLYEQRIVRRRQRLQTAYALAYRHGDGEAMEALRGKIAAFNRAQPGYPITARTIRASVKAADRAAAESEHGIRVDRRLSEVREAGAFAG